MVAGRAVSGKWCSAKAVLRIVHSARAVDPHHALTAINLNNDGTVFETGVDAIDELCHLCRCDGTSHRGSSQTAPTASSFLACFLNRRFRVIVGSKYAVQINLMISHLESHLNSLFLSEYKPGWLFGYSSCINVRCLSAQSHTVLLR
jgi:hypothetical protein